MRDDSRIEKLLARWNLGDAAAAEEAVLACEPYVRMVVRRRLSERVRAKFDSMDIVQSVWADVIQELHRADLRFPDADRLRGYLARAAQNRLIDRLRQHRAALAVECPLDEADAARLTPSREPRPSEVAQADDLWEQMWNRCQPVHRKLLELKRQGLPLAVIAARTGLHEGSVRRILYNLAKQVAFG
jgi:RNA polymerase sigma-70 factor (ECF subfamily)